MSVALAAGAAGCPPALLSRPMGGEMAVAPEAGRRQQFERVFIAVDEPIFHLVRSGRRQYRGVRPSSYISMATYRILCEKVTIFIVAPQTAPVFAALLSWDRLIKRHAGGQVAFGG
jgi:hypothetical protein